MHTISTDGTYNDVDIPQARAVQPGSTHLQPLQILGSSICFQFASSSLLNLPLNFTISFVRGARCWNRLASYYRVYH